MKRTFVARCLFSALVVLGIFFSINTNASSEELTRREKLILQFPKDAMLRGAIENEGKDIIYFIRYQVLHETHQGPLEVIVILKPNTAERVYITCKGLNLFGYIEETRESDSLETSIRFVGLFNSKKTLYPKIGYETVYSPAWLQEIARESALVIQMILGDIGIATDDDYEAYIKKHTSGGKK